MGSCVYLGEEIPVCVLSMGEAAFHVERKEEFPFPFYPCSGTASGCGKAMREPLGQLS